MLWQLMSGISTLLLHAGEDTRTMTEKIPNRDYCEVQDDSLSTP